MFCGFGFGVSGGGSGGFGVPVRALLIS